MRLKGQFVSYDCFLGVLVTRVNFCDIFWLAWDENLTKFAKFWSLNPKNCLKPLCGFLNAFTAQNPLNSGQCPNKSVCCPLAKSQFCTSAPLVPIVACSFVYTPSLWLRYTPLLIPTQYFTFFTSTSSHHQFNSEVSN